MNNHIFYSILQYKHSIVLGEALNVGIVFSFPRRNEIKFVQGNLQRIKSIYPDFETVLPIKIGKNITKKIINLSSQVGNLFSEKVVYTVSTGDSLNEYIKKYIFLEDSTSLQFSESYTAVDVFDDVEKTITEYSRILLPDSDSKESTDKHNENFIIKQFSTQLIKKDIIIDHRFTRNKVIKTKGIDLNFEFAWKNGITHLIKPISFDLKEERDIQKKSVEYYGYFNLLDGYAKQNHYTFDLLLWRPQDDKLFESYQKAIEIIEKSNAPKKIFTEETLSEYIDYTVNELNKKDSQ